MCVCVCVLCVCVSPPKTQRSSLFWKWVCLGWNVTTFPKLTSPGLLVEGTMGLAGATAKGGPGPFLRASGAVLSWVWWTR